MLRSLVFWSVLAGVWAAPLLADAQTIGQPVSLAWDANPEPGVVGYRVYVGTQHGVFSERYYLGKVTSFTYVKGLVGRRYYFAVSAYVAGLLEGPRSSEVSTVIAAAVGGSGGTSTVGAETDPAGPAVVLREPEVSGSTVTLEWSPVGIVALADYLLEAGSSSGLSNLYNGSVGTVTSLSATAGDGTYFVRVRARMTDGATTQPSNEVSFSIGSASSPACTTPPPAPTGVSGSVVGDVATLSWSPTPGATSYMVHAGSASGLTDVFYGNVGADSVVTATVPAGFSAHVRVVAVNACGQSAVSAEIVLR